MSESVVAQMAPADWRVPAASQALADRLLVAADPGGASGVIGAQEALERAAGLVSSWEEKRNSMASQQVDLVQWIFPSDVPGGTDLNSPDAESKAFEQISARIVAATEAPLEPEAAEAVRDHAAFIVRVARRRAELREAAARSIEKNADTAAERPARGQEAGTMRFDWRISAVVDCQGYGASARIEVRTGESSRDLSLCVRLMNSVLQEDVSEACATLVGVANRHLWSEVERTPEGQAVSFAVELVADGTVPFGIVAGLRTSMLDLTKRLEANDLQFTWVDRLDE